MSDLKQCEGCKTVTISVKRLKELEAAQEENKKHYESWKQHMNVSVNNARYIVELEMKLKATERKLAEAEKYKGLYSPINEMMTPLGAHGMIYAKDDRVTAVMDALHDIDGGIFKPDSDYEASKGAE